MTFFILGNHTSLAVAELATAIGKEKDYSMLSNHILLLEEPAENLSYLQNNLAGIVKSGSIIAELPTWNDEQLQDLVLSGLCDVQTESKINFGISLYNFSEKSLPKDLQKQAERLGLSVKKELRKNGQSVRYVSSKEPDLSSVILIENNVLTSGAEFVIIRTKSGFLFGQTETVQNYKAWSERDFGRPARDAKNGMLLPKLARTMINLAGTNLSETTLLDPFCGSGTVLMEAALMGTKNILGSDISEKAIEDTKINTDWIESNLLETSSNTTLFVSPAQNLHEHVKKPVDLIVAETYLGPPRKGNESHQSIKHVGEDLVELNREAFTELFDLLKKGGKAVIAFPVFLTKEEEIHLPLKPLLEAIGFTIAQTLPATAPAIQSEQTEAGGFLYERKGQLVAREILVLEK